MNAKATKHWLVAYDIRDPRRLGRIHRYLRKRAFAAQYSVFVFEGNDAMLEALIADLSMLMDTAVDDVRAYHLPAHCRVWQLGAQAWPEGIELPGSVAARLLRATARPEVAGPQASLDLFVV